MNKRWGYSLLIGGLCGFASAQTQVSLRTQAKSVDLSAIGPTKPMQTGAALPGMCGTGEMFFLTTAAPGSNLYTCASTNVWTGIVGIASLLPGTGAVLTTGGGSTSVAVDPAVIPTKAVVQATTSNIVTLTSSSPTTLTGTGNPTYPALSDKMIVEFTWNQNCSAGAKTLAIDSLAATALKLADGSTNLATTDCRNGQTNIYSYDGSLGVFKLMGGGAPPGGGGGCTAVSAAGQYVVPGAPNWGLNAYGQDATSAVGTMAGGANNTTLLHVHLCAFTPDDLAFLVVTTAGSAGCKTEFGLYNDSKTLVLHTGVITDATTVKCNSTGKKLTTTGTSPACVGCGTTFSEGWYWLAATSNETNMVVAAGWPQPNAVSLINSVVTQIAYLNGAQATTNGALNPSFTTGSGFNVAAGVDFPLLLIAK